VLSDRLMDEVLARSTKRKYEGGWRRWVKYVWPGDPFMRGWTPREQRQKIMGFCGHIVLVLHCTYAAVVASHSSTLAGASGDLTLRTVYVMDSCSPAS
jgi:hypothetical protein